MPWLPIAQPVRACVVSPLDLTPGMILPSQSQHLHLVVICAPTISVAFMKALRIRDFQAVRSLIAKGLAPM